MTKKEKVLNHLQNNKSITSLEAFNLFNATRLSSIIYDLRKEGYKIETLKIPFTEQGSGATSYYGKYIYHPEQQNINNEVTAF